MIMKNNKYIFLLMMLISLPFLLGFIMSDGTLTIEQDIIDSTTGTTQTGGSYSNLQSVGQQSAVGIEDNGASYTNVSGFMFENGPLSTYTGPFYVDITNGSDINDGSSATPFKTIQKAADVMSAGFPNCTVSTTYIVPGLYSEQVDISSNKNPKFMVFTPTANIQDTILSGGNNTNIGISILNSDRIIINGLIIKDFQSAGIAILGNSTNIYLNELTIYSNPNGINIQNSSVDSITIIKSEFYDNETGVIVTGAKNISFYTNLFLRNTNNGILLVASANNIGLDNNNFTSNQFGIRVNNIANNYFQNSYFSGNRFAVAGQKLRNAGFHSSKMTNNDNCFMLSNCSMVMISNYQFFANKTNEILVNTSSNFGIYNCIMGDAKHPVSFFGAGTNVGVESTTLSFGPTTKEGVYVEDYDTFKINNSFIYGNNLPASAGIVITNAVSANNLMLNTYFSNLQIGIRFKYSDSNGISYNTFADCTNGIVIDGDNSDQADTGMISGNTFRACDNGIIFRALTSGIYDNYAIKYNHADNCLNAFVLRRVDYSIIRGNTINNSATNGIYLINTTGAKVSANSIENGKNGIFLDALVKESDFYQNTIVFATNGIYSTGTGTDNRVLNNLIAHNGYSSGYGIFVKGTGWKVANNTLYSNYYGIGQDASSGQLKLINNITSSNEYGYNLSIATTSTNSISHDISGVDNGGVLVFQNTYGCYMVPAYFYDTRNGDARLKVQSQGQAVSLSNSSEIRTMGYNSITVIANNPDAGAKSSYDLYINSITTNIFNSYLKIMFPPGFDLTGADLDDSLGNYNFDKDSSSGRTIILKNSASAIGDTVTMHLYLSNVINAPSLASNLSIFVSFLTNLTEEPYQSSVESSLFYLGGTPVSNVYVSSIDKWYGTIGEGLANANTHFDTVIVNTNVYFENLLIDGFTNLQLYSADWNTNGNKATTRINGSGYTALSLRNSKNVSIRGFTITNAKNGVVLLSSSQSNMIGQNIIKNSGVGIYVDSEFFSLSSNEIYNNSDVGIYLTNARYFYIKNNIITNNNAYGIVALDTSDGSAVSNYISHHTNGIALFEYSRFDITANTNKHNIVGLNILGNTNSIDISQNFISSNRFGIIALDGRGISCYNNTIIDNTNAGLTLTNQIVNNDINNNILTGNLSGFYISRSGNIDIYENTISGNLFDGIKVINTSNLSIYDNSINSNSIGLIARNFSSDSYINNNDFLYNKKGIIYDSVENGNILNNSIFYSSTNGITIATNCGNLNINQNFVKWSTNIGISIADKTHDITISGNFVVSNLADGIIINGSNHGILHNRVYDNGDNGISINLVPGIVVFKNSVARNGFTGFKSGIYSAPFSSSIEIVNNTLYSNYNGIFLDGNNHFVKNNIIVYNTHYGFTNSSSGLSGNTNDVWNNFDNYAPTSASNTLDIHVDPEFIDRAIYNFNLKGTSLCIDAGTLPIYGEAYNGSRPDLGALEGWGTNVYLLSKGQYYQTIQDAVNDADTSGDTIRVYDYITYKENVVISNFQNLIIEAENYYSGGTIDTVLSNPGIPSLPAFRITNCWNVKIQGFVITNYAYGFLLKENSSGSIIKKNSIYATNGVVSFPLSTDNQILTNTIVGLDFIHNGLEFYFGDHVIKGNSIKKFETAIYLKNSSSWIFKNDILTNDYGIIFKDNCNNSAVNSNSIIKASIYGTAFTNVLADSFDFSGNTIKNADISVYLNFTKGIVLSDNKFYTNKNAIFLTNTCSSNLIQYNTFISNNFAIQNYSSSSNYFIDNVFNIYSNAISIIASSNMNIFYNYISGGEIGIFLTNSSVNTIFSNFIFSNLNIGLLIEKNSDSNFILANDIYTNNLGIYLVEATNNIFKSNIYENNSGKALYSLNSGTNTFYYETIQDNPNEGFYFDTISQIIIYRSKFLWNNTISGSALYINNASAGNIVNNTFFANDIALFIENTSVTLDTVNNIFQSSWHWAYTNNASAGQILRYNIFYANSLEGTNLATIKSNNIFANPLIELSNFTITNQSSPAANTGTTNGITAFIPDVSNYNSTMIDIGWWESDYIPIINTGPFYVDDAGLDTNPGTKTMPFRTIQKAADIMSAGLPNCTIATVYIMPGTYSERVDISSNGNAGWMVFTSASNTMPILTGGGNTNRGFNISDSTNIIIKNILIKSFDEGIRLSGSSVSNIFSHNTFYSNIDDGLKIDSDDADQNSIFSNIFYGTNQDVGVKIVDGDNNIVRSNHIYGNKNDGIVLDGTASSNLIVMNTIYSNSQYGIYFQSDDNDNNLIFSNIIYGANQSVGIRITAGDKNTIYTNKIFLLGETGIRIDTGAKTNIIKNNLIYSNKNYGLWLADNLTRGNEVYKNNIYGTKNGNAVILFDASINIFSTNILHNNSTNGFYITGSAVSNVFSQNIIYSNTKYGILIDDDNADNNYIFTNEIFGPGQYAGISFADSDSNTILSNRIYNNTNGIIFKTNTADNIILKNTIYSNTINGICNLPATAILSNIIQTNKIFGNSYGINFNTATSKQFVYGNDIFRNLNDGYYNDFTLVDFKGNSVYSNVGNGINLRRSANAFIRDNFIYHNHRTGIYFIDTIACSNNFFINNTVYSNSTNGLSLDAGNSTAFTFASNNIYANSFSGIKINGLIDIIFNDNSITSNKLNGIFVTNIRNIFLTNNTLSFSTNSLKFEAVSNISLYSNVIRDSYNDNINMYSVLAASIQKNSIINGINGIEIIGAGGNVSTNLLLFKNTVYSNSDYGIRLLNTVAGLNVNNITLQSNIVSFNKNGLQVSGANRIDINHNTFYTNTNLCVKIENTSTFVAITGNLINNNTTATAISFINSGLQLEQNSITNNSVGFYADSSSFFSCDKNNIVNNSLYNFTNNTPAQLLDFTNTWWGTTIVTDIMAKIAGNGGSTNITPYRLFGPFDITLGADTTNMPAITSATAIPSVSGITISWHRPASISGFTRYFVYRTTNDGYTNLSSIDIIATNSLVGDTNYLDTSPISDKVNYYYITALDDSTPYTNESWYSAQASATPFSNPFITNIELYYDDDAGTTLPATNLTPADEMTLAFQVKDLDGIKDLSSITIYIFREGAGSVVADADNAVKHASYIWDGGSGNWSLSGPTGEGWLIDGVNSSSPSMFSFANTFQDFKLVFTPSEVAGYESSTNGWNISIVADSTNQISPTTNFRHVACSYYSKIELLTNKGRFESGAATSADNIINGTSFVSYRYIGNNSTDFYISGSDFTNPSIDLDIIDVIKYETSSNTGTANFVRNSYTKFTNMQASTNYDFYTNKLYLWMDYPLYHNTVFTNEALSFGVSFSNSGTNYMIDTLSISGRTTNIGQLTISGTAQPASTILAGTTNIERMKILMTPNDIIFITNIIFSLVGSATSNEISAVKLYADDDGDTTYSIGDTLLQKTNISGGNASFTLNLRISSATNFFLIYDMSEDAINNKNLSFEINAVASIKGTFTNWTSLTVPAVQTYDTNKNIFVKTDITNSTVYDAGPGEKNHVIMSIFLPGRDHNRLLNTIIISNSGTAVLNTDYSNIRLWADTGDKAFSSSLDNDLGQFTVAGNYLSLSSGVDILSSSGKWYFITADIMPMPVDDRNIVITIPAVSDPNTNGFYDVGETGIFFSGNYIGPDNILTNNGPILVHARYIADITKTSASNNLFVNSSDNLIMNFVLPDSDGSADTLNTMTVSLNGTISSDSNITAIKLYIDDGDSLFDPSLDSLLRYGFLTGSSWVFTNISGNIAVGGSRFYIAFESDQLSGYNKTIECVIDKFSDNGDGIYQPGEAGIFVSSKHWGPVDFSLSNTTVLTMKLKKPELTSITKSTGIIFVGNSITNISGNNFYPGITAYLTNHAISAGNTLSLTNIKVLSAMKFTGGVYISNIVQEGAWDFVVENIDGQRTILSNCYYIMSDNVKPYIVSTSPSTDQYYVLLPSDYVYVSFSEDMRALTITNADNYFIIEDGIAERSFTLLYSKADYTAYIDPNFVVTNDLCKRFTIGIYTNIQDLAGNFLDTKGESPYIIDFRTLIDHTKGGIIRRQGDINIRLDFSDKSLNNDTFLELKNISGLEYKETSTAFEKISDSILLESIDNIKSVWRVQPITSSNIYFNYLNKSVFVSLSYTDADNDDIIDNTAISVDDIGLYYLDTTNQNWIKLSDSYINKDAKRVEGNATYLKYFTLLALKVAHNIEDSLMTAPNPAYSDDDSITISYYLEKSARVSISIYTVTGDLVSILTDKAFKSAGFHSDDIWALSNDLEMPVLAGVYILVLNIEYSDGTKDRIIKKQAVIR